MSIFNNGPFKHLIILCLTAPSESTPDSCGTSARGKTLTMTWTRPKSACNITSYQVLWTRANGFNETVNVESNNNTLSNFTAADFTTEGQVCVAAVVGENMGAWGCCSYGEYVINRILKNNLMSLQLKLVRNVYEHRLLYLVLFS